MSNPMANKLKAKKIGHPAYYGNSGLKKGVDPVPDLTAKSKLGSTTPMNSGSLLQEAGPGTAYAVLPEFEAENPAEDKEVSLAGELVTEVARTSSDVTTLCKTYDLKREELGRLTGFSLRALADWAAGDLPSQPAKRRLHEVRRLLDALSEIVKRESIPQWLHQRNAAFGNLTPLQVIEVGEMDRLWAMVHDLGSGQLD